LLLLLQVGISTILLNYSVISCIDGDAEAQVQCLNVAFLLLEGISDAESKFRTLVGTPVILINTQFVPVTSIGLTFITLQLLKSTRLDSLGAIQLFITIWFNNPIDACRMIKVLVVRVEEVT
jgi:hypothetical protein